MQLSGNTVLIAGGATGIGSAMAEAFLEASIMTKFRGCLFGLLLSTTAVAVAQLSQNEPAVVEVEGGTIRGLTANGVISWKGIPYAAPPVGNLRWRVPQPVRAWQGVREAKAFGPAAMQTDSVEKSEDCLILNVWRPATAAKPLPVMEHTGSVRLRSTYGMKQPQARSLSPNFSARV